MFRPEDQRPMTSQFAVRVAVLSGIALVAFAIDRTVYQLQKRWFPYREIP